MASRARRYDTEARLNKKKVFAVILIFVLIIAIVFGTKKMLDKDSKSIAGKIENVYYYTIYDNGKWGVINSYGEEVVKAENDEMIIIPDYTKDVFICTYDVDYSSGSYKTKIINAKGKEIIKDYNRIEAIANYDKKQNLWYEENVFRVEQDGKYGLVSDTGKRLLECKYNNINSLKGVKNSLLIEQDGKYGICDDLGNVIIEPQYKEIRKIGDDYKNGYIVINNENKYGIIGFDKQVILENKYDEIKDVNYEDLYVVKENGKYIIINKKGEKIVNKEFENISEMNKEYIVASEGGKFGVISFQGEKKVDFKYDELVFTSNNYYIAKSGDKYGVIDISGNEKLKIECVDIGFVKSGNFIIADYLENRKTYFKSI